MKLTKQSAPHIRFQENNRTLMMDIIILLLVLSVPSCLFYGLRALAIIGLSVGTAILADTVCTLCRGKLPNPRDFSPVVTGMILAMIMPATIDYKIVVIAALFAICVAKHPFGGVGHNLFNPAAAGFSFAAICFPQQVFLYPQPFESLPVLGEVSVKLFQNPAFVLKVGGMPTNDMTEMVLGNYPGPMGATNILVIITCLVYLLFRRTVRWQLPVPFLGACALVAFLFPRVGNNPMQSVWFELMSGILLFGAVFLLADPVTSPKRDSSLAIYGIVTGIITMAFRYIGGFEESMPFAILFSNALVPVIDRYNESFHRLIRRKHLETRKTKKTQSA